MIHLNLMKDLGTEMWAAMLLTLKSDEAPRDELAGALPAPPPEKTTERRLSVSVLWNLGTFEGGA